MAVSKISESLVLQTKTGQKVEMTEGSKTHLNSETNFRESFHVREGGRGGEEILEFEIHERH